MEEVIKAVAQYPMIISLLALIGAAVVFYAIRTGRLPFIPERAENTNKDMMERFLDQQEKTSYALAQIAEGIKQMAEAWRTTAQALKDNGDKLDGLRDSIQKGQERLHDRVDKALEAAAGN